MKLFIHTNDAEGYPIAMGKLLAEYRKKMKKSMRGVQIFDREWEESKHPRGQPDNPGQFAKGGSGGSTRKSLTSEEKYGSLQPSTTATKEKSEGQTYAQRAKQQGSSRLDIEEPSRTEQRGSSGNSSGIRVRPDGAGIRASHEARAGEGIDVTFHELESDTGKYFNKYIQASKVGKYAACVNVYPAEDYNNMRTFLTPDGGAGFALKDNDDIVSVFRHPNAQKNVVPAILDLSVEQGGRRLDCFDTVLPELYAKNGFRAVARIPFNDEYKPDGWDYDTFKKYNNGRPDVVFMVYDPEHKQAYNPGDGIKAEDYDEAEKIQKAETAKLWDDKTDNQSRLSEEEFLKGEWLNKPEPEPEPTNKTKDRSWRGIIVHTVDGIFKYSVASLRDAAAFKEEEHPRGQPGNPGEFVSKGQGATKAQQQKAHTPPKQTQAQSRRGHREAGEREAAERKAGLRPTKQAKQQPTRTSGALKNNQGHPGLISPALPQGKNDEYNKPTLDLAKTDAKTFARHIQVYKDHPTAYPLTQQELQGDDNTVARHIIDHIKSNLKFIYAQTPPEERKRSKEWYVGARRLVDEHVKNYKEYNLADTAVAGVYATLSPNNLWDQNVRQGDRMIDIYLKHRQDPWDKKMDDAIDHTKNEIVKTAMRDIQGKKYDELDTPEKKAMWIRIYDEGHAVDNPEYQELGFQPFHKITPEGERQGWYTKPVNVHEFRAFAWHSATMMGKAVRILESNGDPKVIDEALKVDDGPPQHKVRSFYNNILDPHSANEDVTMDTHAVDAAWLMDDPIAVSHNFGDTPELAKRPKEWVSSAPGTVKTGMTGNYFMNAEAYREAAHDLHLEPRELQSIVWETKRKWMETMTDENHKRMHDTWNDYRQGKISQQEAQQQVKSIIDEDLKMTAQEKRDRAKEIRQAKAQAKKAAQKAAA